MKLSSSDMMASHEQIGLREKLSESKLHFYFFDFLSTSRKEKLPRGSELNQNQREY
jgi:hypothetical protein